ncbi:hypothetical protein OIV83_002836 [Microbotryomycetes sp. JL201]|nr:hypothetical protein OIV83_002836 [Microbotryomycetes sp. JL201]
MPEYDPKNMIFKNLGDTGLKVSALSLGNWLTLGGTVKDDPATKIFELAFNSGINTFDTAEIYANGECEKALGKAIKELGWNRDDIVVITKLYALSSSAPFRAPIDTDSHSRLFFGTGKKHPNQNGLSRKHLVEGMRASLKRLELDHVDVVFAHRHDAATPMEEIVRGFNHLIDQGLAFYWGTSEWSAAQITEAKEVAKRLGLVGPCAEQAHYSMLHRERFENEYRDLFSAGMGSTIWSPLESGLLTGKYDNGIPEDSRFNTNKEFFANTVKELESEAGKAKLEKVRKLKAVADKLGTDRASLAIAWTMKNPHVSTVLLGATKPHQLEENLKALDVVPKMTDDIMKEIEDILGNKPQPPPTYNRKRE